MSKLASSEIFRSSGQTETASETVFITLLFKMKKVNVNKGKIG